MKSGWKTFGINSTVRVKPTKYGKRILDDVDGLYTIARGDDGYYYMSMRTLMCVFGDYDVLEMNPFTHGVEFKVRTTLALKNTVSK